MKCPSCGKEIDRSLKFCSGCGVKLQNHFCTSCGSLLNPEQKFCMKCGTPNPCYASNVNKVSGGGFPVYNQSSAPVQNQPVTPVQQFQTTAPMNTESQTHGEPESPVQDKVPTSNEVSVTSTKTIGSPSDEGQAAIVLVEQDAAGKGNSIGKLMLILLLLFFLGGGAMVLGERLGWWDIPPLSWVKSEAQKERDTIEEKMMNDKMQPAMMERGAAQQEEEATDNVSEGNEPKNEIVNTPYSVTLSGLIGGKYGVQMNLEGYATSDGFYPESGKYRYTKYEGAWIALHIDVDQVDDQMSYFKILEYTDGDLTGRWTVHYDFRDDSLTGVMTNAKGDVYEVLLGRSSQ